VKFLCPLLICIAGIFRARFFYPPSTSVCLDLSFKLVIRLFLAFRPVLFGAYVLLFFLLSELLLICMLSHPPIFSVVANRSIFFFFSAPLSPRLTYQFFSFFFTALPLVAPVPGRYPTSSTARRGEISRSPFSPMFLFPPNFFCRSALFFAKCAYFFLSSLIHDPRPFPTGSTYPPGLGHGTSLPGVLLLTPGPR